MRMEDVNERKAYVRSVRKSFDSSKRDYEWEYDTNTKGEAQDSFSFCKIRWLIAIAIFVGYIFCDKTNTIFCRQSAKEVIQKITENYDYSHLKEEITQVLKEI